MWFLFDIKLFVRQPILIQVQKSTIIVLLWRPRHDVRTRTPVLVGRTVIMRTNNRVKGYEGAQRVLQKWDRASLIYFFFKNLIFEIFADKCNQNSIQYFLGAKYSWELLLEQLWYFMNLIIYNFRHSHGPWCFSMGRIIRVSYN